MCCTSFISTDELGGTFATWALSGLSKPSRRCVIKQCWQLAGYVLTAVN